MATSLLISHQHDQSITLGFRGAGLNSETDLQSGSIIEQ